MTIVKARGLAFCCCVPRGGFRRGPRFLECPWDLWLRCSHSARVFREAECAVPVGDVGKHTLHGKRVGEATSSLMVFAVGTLEANLVVAGVDVEPRPPRVPRPRADPLPSLSRCVKPLHADPPRHEDLVTAGVGAGLRPPRDKPRPRTEPSCGAVPDKAEPAGDEPRGGARPGDDPEEDAPLTGTEGLTPSGGAGLSSSGVPQEVPGAWLAGVDPAGASPRSRLVISQTCSKRSIADGSPKASPTARSGETESTELLEV